MNQKKIKNNNKMRKALTKKIASAQRFLYRHLSQKKNYEALLMMNPDAETLARLEKFMTEYKANRFNGGKIG